MDMIYVSLCAISNEIITSHLFDFIFTILHHPIHTEVISVFLM